MADSVPTWSDTKQVKDLSEANVWHDRGRLIVVVDDELHSSTNNAEGLYWSDGYVWFPLAVGATGEVIREINAATDTVLAIDEVLNVAYTVTGAVAITLPPANAFGKPKHIKDTGLNCKINNITVVPDSGIIEGHASHIFAINRMALVFYSDGTNINIR